jgi:hypothetical protein
MVGRKTTPTQRTLKVFRELGVRAGIVERRIQAGPGRPFGHSTDLFGIIDIIALDVAHARGIIGVQVFGQTGWTAHARTICEEREEETRDWLLCGGQLQLWGWRKVKVKRGGKAVVWRPRIGNVILINDKPTIEEE